MNDMRKLIEAVINTRIRNDDIIAQADEFKVVRDGDMVHIIDGEQNIRLSMFGSEWYALVASSETTDYIGEAVQLNEYFVRAGEPYRQIQILNIFSDFTPGQKLSEFEEDFAASPEWMAIEQKYVKVANVLRTKLKAVAKKKLSEEDADAIESVMYEGSDSYADPETACQDLPQIYNDQILAVCELLGIAAPKWVYE